MKEILSFEELIIKLVEMNSHKQNALSGILGQLLRCCILWMPCQLFFFSADAQQIANSKLITINDGLPQGYASGIVQDQDGFIWIGTRDGLARYDGREFKVFHSGDDSQAGLSTNIITHLYIDHKNRIWIFHESGAIDLLNPREEKFSCFTCEPVGEKIFKQFSQNFITVDSHDNLWLINLGHGLWKVDLNNNHVESVSKTTFNHFLSDSVKGFLEVSARRYWVLFANGAQLINDKYAVVKTVVYPASRIVDPGVPFGAVFLTDEQILVRDWHSAFVLDARQSTIEYLIKSQVKEFTPNTTFPQKDPSGNIIIEIMGSLYQINIDRRVVKLWHGEKSQISFCIDRSGVVWLGNGANGIRTIDLNSAIFTSTKYDIGFFHDLLWQEGISFGKKDWLNYPSEYRYGHDTQTRYDFDSKRNLWFTFEYNTSVLRAGQKSLEKLPALEAEASNYNALPLTLANDTCWRAVGGNPVYYEQQSGKWIYPLGKEWKLDKACVVLDMVAKGNLIWATTIRDGLLRIDKWSGQIHWYNKKDKSTNGLPTDELTDIELDPSNDSLIWIGTRKGLVRFNRLTAASRTFTEKNGLPNSTIYCMARDGRGFLWLSTNKGLCKFDPRLYQCQNFFSVDGLQGDEFNTFHKLQMADGRMAFGGTDGITTFDPLKIQQDTFQPTVQFTKLKINNEEVSASDTSVIKTSIGSLSTLELKHDQNFLTFYFAGLQFNNVEKIKYRYRLNGIDPDWNYSGTLGMANYTKIPPGTYELELNASNTAGIWSTNIRRLSVVISPPFWQTSWAYAAYLFLLTGFVVSYIRYNSKKTRLENLVILRNREAEQLRQLNDTKNKFFTNITHEFRTPLTLIIAPVEQMVKDDNLKESDKKKLLGVKQSSQQLLQLINQILELSKLEAGLLKVAVAPIEIVAFLKNITLSFSDIAHNKGLDLLFDCDIHEGKYFIDGDKLERIVSNLLSNAIKFTSPGGQIKLTATRRDGNEKTDIVTIKCIDTGIGISNEVMPFIFDRFYQADDKSNRAFEGTGIGLSLVKELTNLLQGTVVVDSTLGRGTSFEITLPLARAIGTQPLVVRQSDSLKDVAESLTLNSDHEHEEVSQADHTSKPVVMVVEDNDSLRELLREQLSNKYLITTAPNGNEAWKKIINDLPELVVTDLMMPVMDGVSLSKKIRETDATSHIGLIMLTAKASIESRLEGLESGVNDYISKPFNFDELQLRIANLLNHQKKQREFYYNQLLKNGSDSMPKSEVANQFLKRAYQFLDKVLVEKKVIGVEDLADFLNMSSRTLNRKLSTLLGLTANELIRNHRLSEGKSLLRSGLAVSEVAYQVGFESPQYFAQCFKALYDITPTAYSASWQTLDPR
jgi:signal transduction histidine kinase/DNA-binding response OmpR family regulator/streptogramin lyase